MSPYILHSSITNEVNIPEPPEQGPTEYWYLFSSWYGVLVPYNDQPPAQCTMHNAQCTMHNAQCTQYEAPSTQCMYVQVTVTWDVRQNQVTYN